MLVLSTAMQTAVKQPRGDYYTRAANDDCIKGGSGTRTKYSYDASGARVSVGGTMANVVIPSASSTGTYDSNNRLTQFNGVTLAYDANGNTTNDGTNTYTWDARNQLAGLTGSVNASFQYDALGRRIQKVVGASTTGYLYDGRNYVQEQNSSGAVTAALVTGGIDELFTRATSAGISVPIADALGSIIGETNGAQTVTTNYSYDPYGATTQSGTSTGNVQQYTGRENDGSGLYYFRARYYNSQYGRFLSEDPIGWNSGPANNYAYVGGDQILRRDPFGEANVFNPMDALVGSYYNGISGAEVSAIDGGNPGSGAATGAGTGLIGGFSNPTNVGVSTVVGAVTGGGGFTGGAEAGAGAVLGPEDGVGLGFIIATNHYVVKTIGKITAILECIGSKF